MTAATHTVLPPWEDGCLLGFAALDMELAQLARRWDPTAPSCLWWAVAMASRALSHGHLALDLRMNARELARGVAPAGITVDDAWESFVLQWRACTLQSLELGAANLGPWEKHPTIIGCGDASGLQAPLLVFDGHRLYLHRQWDAERRVAASLVQRSREPATPISAESEALLQRWLPSNRSPEGTEPQAPQGADDDQQSACRLGLSRRLAVITGGPGTGKTYTAARLLALLQAAQGPHQPMLRIGLAAPTGKAAARLRQAMEQAWAQLVDDTLPPDFWAEARASIRPASTLHALLGPSHVNRDPELHPGRPAQLPVDVLLVDEASMLDIRMADSLVAALPPDARLVLIGDRHQLASVEAGSVLADMVQGLPAPNVVSLSRSRRFDGPIAAWAQAVLEGDTRTILDWSNAETTSNDAVRCLGNSFDLPTLALSEQGMGPLWELIRPLKGKPWKPDPVGTALAQLDRFRILCALRVGGQGVEAINRAIERELQTRGWASAGSTWYHGRVAMVTRNDPSIGIQNGDVGIVVEVPEGSGYRFAWMQGGEVRSIDCGRLASAETAYAMTVHKSQGSEFDRVALVMPEEGTYTASRELLYTGITRARKQLWLVASPATLARAAQATTHRMGGLADRLSGDDPGGA